MKKIMSLLLSVCCFCYLICLPINVQASTTNSIEAQAEQIYQQMLIDSGLIAKNNSTSLMINENEEISTFSFDPDEKTCSMIVSYIAEDDTLVDAYSAIYRSVATGKEEKLENTKIMGFVITINYNYYYMRYNGYVSPHYQHGIMNVQASQNPMITMIGSFNCVYVSRGTETDSEGSWTGDFLTTVSRISVDRLHAGDRYTVYSGDNGNPYFWKQGSTIEGGCAFSGVAYSFQFGGKTYTDTKILAYDETFYYFDFSDFDWGI